MSYHDGNCYEGSWKQSLFHGQGIFTTATGPVVRYDGTWQAGKLHGKATVIYRDGSTFEGTFKDDKVLRATAIVTTNRHRPSSDSDCLFLCACIPPGPWYMPGTKYQRHRLRRQVGRWPPRRQVHNSQGRYRILELGCQLDHVGHCELRAQRRSVQHLDSARDSDHPP